MRKINKQKKLTLKSELRAPLAALNKKPCCGESARQVHQTLDENRLSFTFMKKFFKKSAFGKTAKNFALGMVLLLEDKKYEALPFLIESNKNGDNWYIQHLTAMCLVNLNRFNART